MVTPLAHAIHNSRRASSAVRCRGVALLLAMIAVLVAGVVGYSYLGSQGTSLGIARNISNRSAARYVAESGLELALAYVKGTSDWRTAKPAGVWVEDEPLLGGTCTIRCDDGLDFNGDGVIGPGEGDGNLADDSTDPATLTVTGRVNGATCVLRAGLKPGVGGSTNIGTTTTSSNSDKVAGVQIATQVVLPTNGRVTALSLYVAGPPPKLMRLAIYSDVAGEPGSLLAETLAMPVGSNTASWRELNLATPIDLAAGTYWLAFCFEHSNTSYYFNETGGQTRVKNHNAIPGGFLSSWGASNASNSRQIGIRAKVMLNELTVDWQ